MWLRQHSLTATWKRVASLRLVPLVHLHIPFSTHTPAPPFDSRLRSLTRELEAAHDEPLLKIPSVIPGSKEVEQWARSTTQCKSVHASRDDAKSDSSGLSGLLSGPWRPLYRLYHDARSSEQVLACVRQIHSRIDRVHPLLFHAYIILSAAKLAQLQYTATLRSLVLKFLRSKPPPSASHCNLLLRALSLHHRDAELGTLVTVVLRAMAWRKHVVRESTYDALLDHRFLTRKVANVVARKMRLENVHPTEAQFKSLLRLAVAHRWSRRAGRYLDAIQQLQRQSGSPAVTYGRDPHRNAPPNAKSTVLNALNIKSFKHPLAALRYMGKIKRAQWKAFRIRLRLQRRAMRTFVSVWMRRSTERHRFTVLRSKPRRLTQRPAAKPQEVPEREWISAMYVAARTKSITSDMLLDMFREGARAYMPGGAAYWTIVRGLMHKHDYVRAAALWDEASSLKLPMDTHSVDIGVRALTMSGQAHRAFAFLEGVHSAHQAWKAETNRLRRYHIHKPPAPRPAAVNLTAINVFMISMRRMGRPDVTFALWDNMQTLYGRTPNVYSLNIVLQNARWARKFVDTIRGQLAYLGIGHHTPPSPDPLSPSDTRAQAVSMITAMLDPRRRPSVTGRWNSDLPGPAALRVAMRVFLGNWPVLRDVEPPVRALRHSSEDIARAPLREAIRAAANRSLSAQSPLLALHDENSTAVYPQIVPTDVTYRALIDLLAAEGLSSEISLVLAWMRVLYVKPSKATIAAALVHWMDVSAEAPLVQRMRGLQHRSAFTQFAQWIADWVGEKNMPGRGDVQAEMRRSAFYRDAQYIDIVTERAKKSRYFRYNVHD